MLFNKLSGGGANAGVLEPGLCSVGIGALTFALLMSARMGIFQETLYKQFGKHSKEALFYNVSNFLNLGRIDITEFLCCCDAGFQM